MKCCGECFNDQEVKGFVVNNSTEQGNCDYCKAINVPLVDARELQEMFLPIISVYATVTELGISEDNKYLLHRKFQDDWKIFSSKSRRVHRKLLIDILQDVLLDSNPIFNDYVDVRKLHESGADPLVHERRWESFANEIKFKNRFFLRENIDLKLLEDLIRTHAKPYNKGKIFYRARVSSMDGYTISQMGKPPVEKATSGRANPHGIPYLYVSASPETTVYESRSSYLDYITVGTFKLSDSLLVVSLRDALTVSPFILADSLENYLIHAKYLKKLASELSKPIRRFDKELDYLPTQFLCEFVKSKGYDGIEYGSALHKNGINLAIFNDEKLTCTKVEVLEIDTMNLHAQPIAT